MYPWSYDHNWNPQSTSQCCLDPEWNWKCAHCHSKTASLTLHLINATIKQHHTILLKWIYQSYQGRLDCIIFCHFLRKCLGHYLGRISDHFAFNHSWEHNCWPKGSHDYFNVTPFVPFHFLLFHPTVEMFSPPSLFITWGFVLSEYFFFLPITWLMF